MSAAVTVLPARNPYPRPPRILIGTVMHEQAAAPFDRWARALAGQQTSLMWDLALVDGTDQPSPWYVKWLVAWSKSRPFGPRHRIRLLRVGLSEGEVYRDEAMKRRFARRMLFDKFQRWTSYDGFLSLAPDRLVGPSELDRLFHLGDVADGGGQLLECTLVSRRAIELLPLRLTSAPEVEQFEIDCRWAGLKIAR